MDQEDWIKIDLHIHTLDDPKDVIDYTAHQLLERAHSLGFGVLAITLHDAVFDRPEVFADAAKMGILLISAAEMRLEGADVILLNVAAEEIAGLKTFADLRALRARRGNSLFTIAPHPFYVLGGSIGRRLFDEIDCFDGIELCHFHKGLLNPNRRAAAVAKKFRKPLIATSDAHQLHAFGRHYTSIPRPVEAGPSRTGIVRSRGSLAWAREQPPPGYGLPRETRHYTGLTPETVFDALRNGPMRLTSPSASLVDFASAIYFVFIAHPLQLRRHGKRH